METAENPWPVVELRQYTLRPGSRDTLIDLFDREFVETQEDCGMRLLGQFRDEDDPDRFVWLRAFHDLPDRTRALTEFYLEGQAWRTHAPAARETMVDTDDALLLRALRPAPLTPRAETGHTSPSRFLATVHQLTGPAEDGFAAFFDTRIRPLLAATGATPIAVLVTDPAPNTFERLPVRTGESVLVWLAAFADAGELARHRQRLAEHPEWINAVRPELERHLAAPDQTLRLAPTSRSRLR